MKRFPLLSLLATLLLGISSVALADTPTELASQGHYREALDLLRPLLAHKEEDTQKSLASALELEVLCLDKLGHWEEFDALVHAATEAQPRDWRLLAAAARAYLHAPHEGIQIENTFHRADFEGTGMRAPCLYQDRAYALRHFQSALTRLTVEAHATDDERRRFYLDFAEAIVMLPSSDFLLRKTDLSAAINLIEQFHYNPAEVDSTGPDGLPIYHHIPATWAEARTDGERWRWLLDQTSQVDAQGHAEAQRYLARLMRLQIGDKSISNSLFKPETFDTLAQLADDETLAELPDMYHLKRFKVPDEFNPIRLYAAVAESSSAPNATAEALQALGEIFEARRQLSRADRYWQTLLQLREKVVGKYRWENAQQHHLQIVGNWGRFNQTEQQLAGRPCKLNFAFRNAKAVTFVARPVKLALLFAAVKDEIRRNPHAEPKSRTPFSQLGTDLLEEASGVYLDPQAAQWTQHLRPGESHLEQTAVVDVPWLKAGAYWIEAQVEHGNTCHMLLWIADTLLLRETTSEGELYLTVDAITGAPMEGAKVEAFGYRVTPKNQTGPRSQVDVQIAEFSGKTNAQGALWQHPNHRESDMQWVGFATTRTGGIAALDFGAIAAGDRQKQSIEGKAYVITDRPIYRPGQAVKFKLWIGMPSYDQEPPALPINKAWIVIKDPQSKTVYARQYPIEHLNAISGEFTLPSGAVLGEYSMELSEEDPANPQTSTAQMRRFRVEDYKKPEFEVTVDAPSEPGKPGEKIKVTIRAHYYSGGPVTHAQVRYKVTQTSQGSTCYPNGNWAWLYGPGYDWLPTASTWYPAWNEWSAPSPVSYSYGGYPELVTEEKEGQTDEEGKLNIEIETPPLKRRDLENWFHIEAAVVDASRRLVNGEGWAVSGAEPLHATMVLDRGFYDSGAPVTAQVHTEIPGHGGTAAKGTLRLLAITYSADGKPVEKEVSQWNASTNTVGDGEVHFPAPAPGSYRIDYRAQSSQGDHAEQAQLLTIVGPGFDGSACRFNDLELIPERREYSSGDELRLLINANRAHSYVVLFERAREGDVKQPRFVQLEGKSTVISLKITDKDQPNRFIKAFVVSDGHIESVSREIIVPPQSKILNLSVTSVAKARPQDKATIHLQVTDSSGHPFSGSLALTMYDKSLEYISEGSNIPDIRPTFWRWKYQADSNVPEISAFSGANLDRRGSPAMLTLGLELIASERSIREALSSNSDDDASQRIEESRKYPTLYESRTSSFEMDSKVAVPPPMPPSPEDVAPAPQHMPHIRAEFADSAYWSGNIETKRDGTAEVTVTLPDNLTTWKIRAWVMGQGLRVGEGSTELITSKDLLVRLQTPRFLVEHDEVTLSANVHNEMEKGQVVKIGLVEEGHQVAILKGQAAEITRQLPAKQATRMDWQVRAVSAGEAKLRVQALGQDDSDAMEIRLPVHLHGMRQLQSYSLVLRPASAEGKLSFTAPEKLRPEETLLEVRCSPSLASSLVQALPYLADYPYGCTEQTLDRFLPSIITQNTLRQLGLRARDLARQPREAVPPGTRENPLRNEAQLNEMVKAGIDRLVSMRNEDGGWGWFSGNGEKTYPHTTSWVVRGLAIAQENGVRLPQDVLKQGLEWLSGYQQGRWSRYHDKPAPAGAGPLKHLDDDDALIFSVLARSHAWHEETAEALFQGRDELSVYSKALLGIAFHQRGKMEQSDILLRNIAQYVQVDAENQTAHLHLPNQHSWWHWYGDEVETAAACLEFYSAVEPHGEITSGLAKYLVSNRRETHWNSTRDTALCVEALANYMIASGEKLSGAEAGTEVWLDGVKHQEIIFTPATVLWGDATLTLRGAVLSPGKHELVIRKKGNAPLYVNASLGYFTLEDAIPGAGLDLKVARHFWKLRPVSRKADAVKNPDPAKQATVSDYERAELPEGAEVQSGDLIESELVVESKNDCEYVLLQDQKPAGLEPMDLRSGYTDNELSAYVQLQDNGAAFFIRALPRGRHSLTYRLRAETPGIFHAMPAQAGAMYAPALRGNSAETVLKVSDRNSGQGAK